MLLFCMCSHGMEANVTLHWFASPAWFEDLGGFNKEENIHLFAEWAALAFKLFGAWLMSSDVGAALSNF